MRSFVLRSSSFVPILALLFFSPIIKSSVSSSTSYWSPRPEIYRAHVAGEPSESKEPEPTTKEPKQGDHENEEKFQGKVGTLEVLTPNRVVQDSLYPDRGRSFPPPH